MGASCVIVRGGFEGLGDPELDAQHDTSKVTRRLNSSQIITASEVERNSLSMSATHMATQRQREDSQNSLTDVNPDGKAVPIRIQTGISSSSRFMDFKYLMGLNNPCPWAITPPPPSESPNLPLSSAEAEPEPFNTTDPTITSHRVRFSDKVQVLKIENESVEPNLKTINKIWNIPSKSSNPEASPDLISHAQGQINNPASNTNTNRDLQSHLKGLFKKFK